GPLRIQLQGRALRPVCHFELVESPEYLGRRVGHLLANERGAVGAPIEAPSVRVVELVSRGTRVRNTKRFRVVNPTAVAYDFSWEPQGDPHAAWRCTAPRGSIMAGKWAEMVFEYTPDDIGVAEAFFRFKVAGHGISELFLFAGTVAEPVVALDRTRLDFGALLLGARHTETVHIVNREDLPYSFTFDRNALRATQVTNGQRRPVLEIRPMTGLLPPGGRVPVQVTFCPREEKPHNLNLQVIVRKKSSRLSLNVKGEGYRVHARFFLETDETDITASTAAAAIAPLLPRPAVNTVDFGAVNVHERSSRRVTLVNAGKYAVDYLCIAADSTAGSGGSGGGKIGGTVRRGERAEMVLEFAPTDETALEGAELTCAVAGKHEYLIRAAGRGTRPALHFSFSRHDFGPCFVAPPGQPPAPETALLRVSNRDPVAALSLDCAHQRDRCLWVDCEPRVLEPGEVVDVPIHFAPREPRPYAFAVPFVVNGTASVRVAVAGEGCPVRLELAAAADRQLTFGVVAAGAAVTKTVRVVNRSRRPLPLELLDPEDAGIGRLSERCVTFAFPLPPPPPPTDAMTAVLAPRASTTIAVTFAPTRRLTAFTESLWVRAGPPGTAPRAVLTVSGQSTGHEARLDVDALPFGTICLGSRRAQRFRLENRGDAPARFRWLPVTFGPHFRISPLEGVAPPLSEVGFEAVFEPAALDDDVRRDGIVLEVEGLSPLALTCTGRCVPLPEDGVRDLRFASRARQPVTQDVAIANPTDQPWYLTAVLRGEHWQHAVGDGELTVPARSTAEYRVTFCPLAMTAAASADGSESGGGGSSGGDINGGGGGSSSPKLPAQHEGSLFFALPDGGALLYRLHGTAAAPASAGTVELSTPAKTALSFTVPVTNWLRRPQRLSVRVELTVPASAVGNGTDSGGGNGPVPAGTAVTGATAVEVPALATKPFALRFLAFREGPVQGRVVFANNATGEFLFHELKLTATEPLIQETVELEATVRAPVRRVLAVLNPLPAGSPAVTFPEPWWRCDSPYVRLRRLGDMAGGAEGAFEVEYRPLLPSEGRWLDTDLLIETHELGRYRYKLRLRAKAPPPRPGGLRFEAALGAVAEEQFTFRAHVTGSSGSGGGAPAVFKCRLE
ncbi:unnamed protein product, partial [Phaeothamnion confervicola]